MTVSEKRKTVKTAAENALRKIRRDISILYSAYRDPRTPWYAKAAAAAVLGYALSPIDLIPDFLPFIGYLDDLIIIPAGIFLVKKMIPYEVIRDAQIKADREMHLPVNYTAACIIILIWVLLLSIIIFMLYGSYYHRSDMR